MDVTIVGDGPGGLSAALFLARAGHRVVAFGQDQTAMNWATVNNYLGIDSIAGPEFQRRARAQAVAAGAELRDAKVVAIVVGDGGFVTTVDGGATVRADAVILSEGKAPTLARGLGCAEQGGRVQVDAEGLTSVPGVYAIGRMVRPTRSQAVISAGDGAKAALDLIARAAGRDVQDWDPLAKD